jgi:anti-anti-sigma factor
MAAGVGTFRIGIVGCGQSVILDLSGIGYASSSALGALVALNRRLRARGGRLALSGLCPVVAQALAVSGFGEAAEG